MTDTPEKNQTPSTASAAGIQRATADGVLDRDPATGRFTFGNKLGAYKREITWATVASRIEYYSLHYTVQEVIDIYEGGGWKKFSSHDGDIIKAIALSHKENGCKTWEAVCDRLIGKSLQRGELTGADGGPLAFSDERRAALRSKLVQPASDSGAKPKD